MLSSYFSTLLFDVIYLILKRCFITCRTLLMMIRNVVITMLFVCPYRIMGSVDYSRVATN